ncbi:MAG: DUF1778 domain-containing protein [Rhodospirillales bacterium]|nr:DUF1778 domain-containing protein [Rhodospirillales bacterium]
MSTIAKVGRREAAYRGERLEARVSAEQKAFFQRAAELQGRTLTGFIIASAQEAAARTIEDAQMVRLNAEESRAFAEALLHPRDPAADVQVAARRYVEALSAHNPVGD